MGRRYCHWEECARGPCSLQVRKNLKRVCREDLRARAGQGQPASYKHRLGRLSAHKLEYILRHMGAGSPWITSSPIWIVPRAEGVLRVQTGNGGCWERGEPAGALFNATARDDQHKYSDRSLRETSRGSSRAAPGAQPSFRSGQVRFITRPKSMTMRVRVTRQLMLPRAPSLEI